MRRLKTHCSLDPGFRRDERVLGCLRNIESYIVTVKHFYTYILASKRNGTLYTGSTDELAARIWQHKEKTFKGFTEKYGVDTLVWFETHETRDAAFRRERQIKEWKRAWKLELIEAENPDWIDLFETLNQ